MQFIIYSYTEMQYYLKSIVDTRDSFTKFGHFFYLLVTNTQPAEMIY